MVRRLLYGNLCLCLKKKLNNFMWISLYKLHTLVPLSENVLGQLKTIIQENGTTGTPAHLWNYHLIM